MLRGITKHGNNFLDISSFIRGGITGILDIRTNPPVPFAKGGAMGKLCIDTEVGFTNAGGAKEFLARAGKYDPSRFEHVGARRDG